VYITAKVKKVAALNAAGKMIKAGRWIEITPFPDGVYEIKAEDRSDLPDEFNPTVEVPCLFIFSDKHWMTKGVRIPRRIMDGEEDWRRAAQEWLTNNAVRDHQMDHPISRVMYIILDPGF
jgi:hypothetical protein